MKPLFLLLLVGCLLPFVNTDHFMCPICTVLIGAVEEAIENDQNSIDEIGKDVCNRLFKDNFFESIACNALAEAYISEVEEDIRNKEKPEVVCKKIKAC